MPGDTATGQPKVPFQRDAFVDINGHLSNSVDLEFPDAAEVRIETVTVEARLPIGQSPKVRLGTTVNGVQVDHFLAAQSEGTYVESGALRQQFCGTHYIRLLSDRGGENPPTVKVDCFKLGAVNTSGSGFGVCQVTISGYTTPLPLPR